jgi:hypothetical protein
VAAGAQWWGRAREVRRGRGKAGEGWHGSGILRVLYIGRGDEVRGLGRKSGGRRLMALFRVGRKWGKGKRKGRGGERMGRQCRFGWSGGAWEASRWSEVSRVAALRSVAGGGLGCLT